MARRPRILLVCLVVVVAVMVLASSLHDVHFEPGQSFAAGTRLKAPSALPAIQIISETPVGRIFLFWLALVAYLILFLLLLPPQLRKRILRQVLSFAIGLLALVLALRFKLLQLPAFFGAQAADVSGDTSELGRQLPLPVFRAPSITPWIAYAVSLVVLWALAVLAWILYRKWRSFQGSRSSPLGAIQEIARASLDDLAAGRHWADVVIEAYAKMSEAVAVRRGLRRHHATTPREFADRLTRSGLPTDAVAGLTRLFESVRYGGRSSSEAEVKEAVAYLESILQACRGST